MSVRTVTPSGWRSGKTPCPVYYTLLVSGHMAPNQPRTPARVIRVPDEVWRAIRELADRENTSPSDIVRRALTAYIQEQQR